MYWQRYGIGGKSLVYLLVSFAWMFLPRVITMPKMQVLYQTIRRMSGVSGFCRTVSHVSNVKQFTSTKNRQKEDKWKPSFLFKVKVIKVNSGNCFAKLTLQEDDLNPMGGMHGGLAATLIDNISSTGLLSHSKWREPSPTIRLNLS